MTAPPVQTDQATPSSATPFEADIGQMFGDYSISAEPATEDSAAGTTPAEPSEEPVSEADGQPATDGAQAAEPQSEGPTPDATTAPPEEDDPFKDTTPAQLVVNGHSIPVEDIRVFKEGGAVIRPESLPNVLAKLAERETLSERVRTRDAEYTTLSKVSEWTDQSSGKTYTGPEAAVEMRIGNASLFAENQLVMSVLTDPDALARCLTTAKGPDGKERVIFSPDALEDMKRENTLNQREIAQAIRAHYGKVVSEASKPAPAPIDFPKATDALISDLSKAANLDASALTPADRTMLAKQLPYHIKDGLASLDWQEMVKERIALRAEQKAASAKLVPTITDAVKKGQAAMAAAARGVRTPAKAPAAPVRPTTPQQQRTDNEGDLYDAMERAGAAAMRSIR